MRARNNLGNWGPADHFKVRLENCDDHDGCYRYGSGCEERDYFCKGGKCKHSTTNKHTDYYGNWVSYCKGCKGDEVWRHRRFHDYYCEEGKCTAHGSWTDDQLVENCSDYDCWQDTGKTQWVTTKEYDCRTEQKEEKEQEFRDFFCTAGECSFKVTETKRVETGRTRTVNKPNGTVCGCTANSTLKKCLAGVCLDTGVCNTTYCGADLGCDGKKPGDACGGGAGAGYKCSPACKCVPNRPPVAAFTYSPLNAAVVNETVTFDGSNSTDGDGFIVRYEWDFGDGEGTTTSTTENWATHRYSSAGQYRVNLTVTDNDGAKSATAIWLTVWVKGDLDGDGSATMSDLHLVAGMVVGTVDWGGGLRARADFNENGRVDVGDAAKLLGFVKGGEGCL
ncbi:MAG TPA: PKD domain-containing protein [Methanomicrobia archaeon]|nr:PKD domain-containing protein [Methanomicrobia archaeon]